MFPFKPGRTKKLSDPVSTEHRLTRIETTLQAHAALLSINVALLILILTKLLGC